MSFRLQSVVQIGAYQIKAGINEATVKRSVKEVVDKATLKIPAMGKVNAQLDALNTETSIQTSALFKEGDPVTIQLGYNGDLRQEFKGFVRRVTAAIPVEIECEGYGWQLRRKYFVKSWKSVLLLEFLKELIAGTDIKLSPLIPKMTLTNLCIKNANGLEVLEYIKDKVHLSVYFVMDVLYVGLEEGVKGNTVSYSLGYNCVRNNNLKYRKIDDTRLLIRLVTGKGKNHKRPLYEIGDKGGSLIEENIAFVRDAKTLHDIAKDLLVRQKYTGYEGFISGFLQPYCQPTDTVTLIDKRYKTLGGNFFVEATEVVFGLNGATRKVHITRALN